MSEIPMLSHLAGMGVHVDVDGSELTLKAPKGVLTENLVSEIRGRKREILDSLRDLKDLVGEDWAELSRNPEMLASFTQAKMVSDTRERGIVPPHYTAVTDCHHCGPVPIFEGCAPQVLGCPWCFADKRPAT